VDATEVLARIQNALCDRIGNALLSCSWHRHPLAIGVMMFRGGEPVIGQMGRASKKGQPLSAHTPNRGSVNPRNLMFRFDLPIRIRQRRGLDQFSVNDDLQCAAPFAPSAGTWFAHFVFERRAITVPTASGPNCFIKSAFWERERLWYCSRLIDLGLISTGNATGSC